MRHDSTVSIEKIHEAYQNLLHTNYERWIHDVLFSFNWWFLLVIAILPLIIWRKLVDKKSASALVTLRHSLSKNS